MNSSPSVPQLDVEKFQEQVGHDPDLLVEIIDLFLLESAGQVHEMHEALGCGEYKKLSRVAHTIKGSVGSLYAETARLQAHELESIAESGDEAACRRSLAALEEALAMLQPQLLALRESFRQQ